MNNSEMPLPSSIDGVTGFENNAELNFMKVDGPNNDGGVIRPDEVGSEQSMGPWAK